MSAVGNVNLGCLQRVSLIRIQVRKSLVTEVITLMSWGVARVGPDRGLLNYGFQYPGGF